MGVRDRRRAALIVAARELFLERGLAEVTIDDIADRVNVTRRTVYRYFPTRDHVALAVEVSVFERWAAVTAEREATWSGTAVERFDAAIGDLELLIDDAADEVRFTREFDGARLVERDPELDAAFRAAITSLLAPIVAILEAGKLDGTLHLPGDPVVTAATINNAYIALAQRVYGRGDQLADEQSVDPRALLSELSRMYRAALRPPGS